MAPSISANIRLAPTQPVGQVEQPSLDPPQIDQALREQEQNIFPVVCLCSLPEIAAPILFGPPNSSRYKKLGLSQHNPVAPKLYARGEGQLELERISTSSNYQLLQEKLHEKTGEQV
jgi:hypothetical protein